MLVDKIDAGNQIVLSDFLEAEVPELWLCIRIKPKMVPGIKGSTCLHHPHIILSTIRELKRISFSLETSIILFNSRPSYSQIIRTTINSMQQNNGLPLFSFPNSPNFLLSFPTRYPMQCNLIPINGSDSVSKQWVTIALDLLHKVHLDLCLKWFDLIHAACSQVE